MAQLEFKTNICNLLKHTNLNFRCTDRPNFPWKQLSNHQSTHSVIGCKPGQTHKVGLVSEISHLYNPLPVCVLTYKGSLSWLLHRWLWRTACCSRSPPHLRTELAPAVPKQPGEFHWESAKVRAVCSGSTAITVSQSPGDSVPLHNSDTCTKRIISVKPQNSLAGWLAWV